MQPQQPTSPRTLPPKLPLKIPMKDGADPTGDDGGAAYFAVIDQILS